MQLIRGFEMVKLLIIILDGASFIFTNTFCWFMDNVMWFWSRFKRGLMYIDEPPLTPCVVNSMFTGLRTQEHGVIGFSRAGRESIFIGEFKGKYLWDEAAEKGLKVKVLNVPCKIPTVNINVDLYNMDWIDCFAPPKDNFEALIERYHSIVRRNLMAECDLFIVWYPIPDQAHHHFFAIINNYEKLHEAFKWYNRAFGYAKDLIELSRPESFMILSDHGFMSDFEEYIAAGKKQHIHIRDGLAVTNIDEIPRAPRDVYRIAKRILGIP